MNQEYHIPVLLNESLEGLNIKPNGVYVDVTFGGGGHSSAILKKLDDGRLLAFDQDVDAERNKLIDDRLTLIRQNFRYITNFLRYHQVTKVDGILADLGVSSYQFDTADRGFSFRFNGDLDMRMDQGSDLTAAKILNTYERNQLFYIFRTYGEVLNVAQLVNTIEAYREKGSFKTIKHFIEVINRCLPPQHQSKYLAKVFQALRMEVNGEIDALKELLMQTTGLLKPGGRLVVITYHSLEDRLVKKFIKSGNFEGDIEKDLYGNPQVPFEQVNRKIIRPTNEEISRNSRSKSAKLRVATRLAEKETQ